MGRKVPAILLSGDHKKVDEWRRERSIERTLEHRPDLLDETFLSKKEKKFLAELRKEKETPADAENSAAPAGESEPKV